MNEYAILRTHKLKSKNEVKNALAHVLRSINTTNADPNKKNENLYFFNKTLKESIESFENLLPKKPRKNAVLGIEYLIAASPSYFDDADLSKQNKYFHDAIKFLQNKHGTTNVFQCSLHRDETSPHCHIFVVPNDEKGNLNCRRFLGGAATLRKLQTSFAEVVGIPNGLKRGSRGSKSKHTTIKKFYEQLNQIEMESQEPLPTKKDFFSSLFIKNKNVEKLKETATNYDILKLKQKADVINSIHLEAALKKIEQQSIKLQEYESQEKNTNKIIAGLIDKSAISESTLNMLIAKKESSFLKKMINVKPPSTKINSYNKTKKEPKNGYLPKL